MKFEKRDVYFIVVVVVFVAFLSLFKFNLTGNVVWEPTTTVVNCTNSQILALWDEIFVEGSSGVTILKNGTADCTDFIVYKTSSQKVLLLLSSQTVNPPTTITRLGISQKPNITKEILAGYSNLTTASMNKFIGNMTSHSLAESYIINNYSSLDIYNWTITLPDSETKYRSDFDNSIGGPFEDVPFSNGFVAGGEINQTFDLSKSAMAVVGKNQSFTQFYLVATSYYNVTSSNTTLKQNISNYTFESNSSWNYAFDLTSIFNYSSGVSIGFDYTGANNTGGQNINWTINGTRVYFKPAISYIGSQNFRLSAMSSNGTVYSNMFKVTIAENLNDPPRLKYEFEQLFVPRVGNLTVPLDMYFEDPDGDSLTYNNSYVKNITVSFSGGNMIITLNENFTDYEIFYVYASDGELSEGSNKIYVFEDLEVVAYTANETNESFFIGMYDGNGTSFGGNVSGNNTETNSDGENVGWIFWILGGFMFLLLVGGGIYFIFLNKPPKQVVGPNPQVQNYLEEVTGLNKPLEAPLAPSGLEAEPPKPEGTQNLDSI